MARAEPSELVETAADALGLLSRDHRLVEELFREFEIAGKQQLDPLSRRLCKLLRVHAQIEEELFYPAARRALRDDALLGHAEQQHAQAKETIVRLESMSSDDETFVAVVRQLAAVVTAHVAEEESALFPRLRKSKMDLTSLGLVLAERRDTLLDVIGLHADDEEAAVYPAENPAVALAVARRQREAGG